MSDIISTIDDRLIDRLSNDDLLLEYAMAVSEMQDTEGDDYASRLRRRQARKDAAEYRAEILTRMGC